MEITVSAQSQNELLDKAKQQSTEGPWYYRGTNEPVPTTEKITVEGVEKPDAMSRLMGRSLVAPRAAVAADAGAERPRGGSRGPSPDGCGSGGRGCRRCPSRRGPVE